MAFSSLSFLLFLFLCLVIQGFCPTTRKKNRALLIFSLVFYLWGGIQGLLLLVVMTAINWYAAIKIQQRNGDGIADVLVIVTVLVDVLALGLVRFWTFLPWVGEGTLSGRYVIPMGFAFYTLQLISYVVDTHGMKFRAQEKFSTMLLYSGMFAQSAGGPIVRYDQIRKSLKVRKVKASMVSRGIMRFACGLAKKVVLADSCGAVVSALLGEDVSALATAPVLSVWLGSVFFMLQLFLDLSAYADMAVGLGLLFGFRFPENFDYPYVAGSLREFWSRWYMTVVEFFRDYVYRPLGADSHGTLVAVLNMLITGLLFGLWSGTGANFMIWMAYVVVLLAIEGLLDLRYDALPSAVRHIWVVLTMMVGFVLFRYTDLGMLAVALKGLVGLNGAGFATAQTGSVLVGHLGLLILSVIAATPLVRILGAYIREKARVDVVWLKIRLVVEVACPTLLLLLSVMAMVGNQIPEFTFFGL